MREGRVHRQISHRQDPQVGHSEDLNLNREGRRCPSGLPDFPVFLTKIVIS